jgi:hypothetical protein
LFVSDTIIFSKVHCWDWKKALHSPCVYAHEWNPPTVGLTYSPCLLNIFVASIRTYVH